MGSSVLSTKVTNLQDFKGAKVTTGKSTEEDGSVHLTTLQKLVLICFIVKLLFIIIYFFIKQATLKRRSTALSLPP